MAGVLRSRAEVQQAADMCAAAGAWLVLDNTYEDFLSEVIGLSNWLRSWKGAQIV